MPKLISDVMMAQLRLIKPIVRNLDIESSRKYQDLLGDLGAKALKNKVEYKPEKFEHFEADLACPVMDEGDEPARFAVLYLHGGSYTCGSLAYARGFGGILCADLKAEVLCVGYRLAPEHPFPRGLNDAESAYRRLLERYDPKNIAVVGESAGGGMCFSLCLKLKKDGLPQPACIVALSPWTDLTFTGRSYEKNAALDPMLSEDALRFSAGLYACGHDPADPLISPVFGDLTGLPPTLIFAGDRELLEDDSDMISRRLTECGVENTLHKVAGMWHVYVLFGIPEAKDAIEKIKRFIPEKTGK